MLPFYEYLPTGSYMNSSIGLINTYSTLNIGDSAIYSALASMASDAQVFAHVQDAEPEYTPGLQILDRLPLCDVYISVGGDIFNNAREGLITKAFLKNLSQLTQSPRRTFLFGQSIPRSCHGLSFVALTFLLRRLAAVCVRDAESHKRLTQAGVPTILSYDTAFSLSVGTPAKEYIHSVLAALDIQPDTAALISLRAFDSMYAHDNQQFQQNLIALCRNLHRRGYQPVLLIQSQAYGADNDLAVAEHIVQQVPGVKIFSPFLHQDDSVYPRFANWELVMAALAICRLTIAVRYHTAVLSLASGRVPFNLYYSNKGRDLSQRLGIPGCSLDQFDPDETLEVIEKTADQVFDHAALRAQVTQDFQICYQKAIAR
jgi:polysaccharide pyruvyl transferase WcaK-like protein